MSNTMTKITKIIKIATCRNLLAISLCYQLVGSALGAGRVGDTKLKKTSIVLVDGKHLNVNGRCDIPRGMFGIATSKPSSELIKNLGIELIRSVHYLPGATCSALDAKGGIRHEYNNLDTLIDCQGASNAPATVLTNPNFEKYFRDIAVAYANKCKLAKWAGCVEFWDEPFYNWAQNRGNYKPAFYDKAKASENGRVTILGQDKPLEYLRWRSLWAKDKRGKLTPSVRIPKGLKPNETFRAVDKSRYASPREQTFTVVKEWNVWDPTQKSWWSGRQNREFYISMLLPFAKALKEANPDIRLIAGWDYDLSADNWSVWRELYKPVINASIEYLDGFTEHHSDTDAKAVAAWYEVAVTHTMLRNNKWLMGYNTGASGSLNSTPRGFDTLDEKQKDAIDTTANTAAYMLRDILAMMHYCPGKIASRVARNVKPSSGQALAFKLLKPLRGKLINSHSDNPDIWSVASFNKDKLVVAIFNDSASNQHLKLSLLAPTLTKFSKAGIVSRIEVDHASGVLHVGEMVIKTPNPTAIELEQNLLPRETIVITLPLTGPGPASPQLLRKQLFAKEGVVRQLRKNEKLTFHVPVSPKDLALASGATARVVLQKQVNETLLIKLNGRRIKFTPRSWINDIKIPLSNIKADNVFEFSTAGPKAKGSGINAVSIILDIPLADKPADKTK